MNRVLVSFTRDKVLRAQRLAACVLLVGSVWACSSDDPVKGKPMGTGDGDIGDGDGDGDEDTGDGDSDGDGDGDSDGDGDGDVGDGDGDVSDDDGGIGEGCMLGEAGSFATDQMLNLFGEVVFFAKGKELPKGRYRVAYEDGCMKYGPIFGWTVNNSADGPQGWWLVAGSSTNKVKKLPGKDTSFDFFSTLDDCVKANKDLAPVEFEFDGGKLGIWVEDSPYTDNSAGDNGRNPKWKLTLLVEECPPDLVLL